MKNCILLLMLFVSIRSFSQDCPCVKAAIIGTDATAFISHNNKVVVMDNVTINLGESINLYTKENIGKINWYKDGLLVSNTLVTPTETTEYTAKSKLDGCPDAIATVQIKVQKTSVDQLNNEVSISPNPTHSNLIISTNNKIIKSINITNLLGETVKTLDFSSHLRQQSVNISSLTAGVYILNIEVEGENTITKKIIKN
jgi:hypothetical protein